MALRHEALGGHKSLGNQPLHILILTQRCLLEVLPNSKVWEARCENDRIQFKTKENGIDVLYRGNKKLSRPRIKQSWGVREHLQREKGSCIESL